MMKVTSIRHLRSVTCGGIALMAVLIFSIAVIAPDALGQLPRTDNLASSPLGIASAVEYVVAMLFS